MATSKTAYALVLTFAFLVALWWRGTSLAHDEVTLDTVRNAFQWALAVVIGAVVIDAIADAEIVSGFLILGFFAVGLFGLSLARFSAESADVQVMSREWFIPIGAAVGAVLLLALLISGLGLGGLDDVTRFILRVVGTVGEWILKPILLGLGYIAAALVSFGNWLTSVMGGGDLSGLREAQEQMRRFHESLEDVEGGGVPQWVYTLNEVDRIPDCIAHHRTDPLSDISFQEIVPAFRGCSGNTRIAVHLGQSQRRSDGSYRQLVEQPGTAGHRRR